MNHHHQITFNPFVLWTCLYNGDAGERGRRRWHWSGGEAGRWPRRKPAKVEKSSKSRFHGISQRPDSPTVEASVVLFSLETLIITVSAGAVAALVVGFVTGPSLIHRTWQWSGSGSIKLFCCISNSILDMTVLHTLLSGFTKSNIPIKTLQEKVDEKLFEVQWMQKWPKYGNEINNFAFCTPNILQATQNLPNTEQPYLTDFLCR